MPSLKHQSRNDAEYCCQTLIEEERQRAQLAQKYFYHPKEVDLSITKLIFYGLTVCFWAVILGCGVSLFLGL